MTYEEANAAKSVGYIYTCRTVQNNLAPVMMEHIALGTPEAATGTTGVYREEVVNALKAQIAHLEGYIEGLNTALEIRNQALAEARNRTFTEPGWFLPKEMVTDNVGISLDHLINKAKHTSIVNVVVAPGQPYEIVYEADWVKYLRKVEPSAIKDDQTWIVKLGSAVASLHEPVLIHRLTVTKLEEMVKRMMERCGHPESRSVYEAFMQLANEITYGSISLESAVQEAAGTNGNPHAVSAERLAGNASAQSDCADPKNCCTRNRPLNDQDCKRKPSIVNAAPEQVKVHTDLGVPDVSSREFTCAECPNQAVLEGCCGRNTLVYPEQTKPVYAVSALTDPTTIQKAVVMGMVGTPKQQEEAREFLAQHIQLVNDYPVTMSTAMQRQ
jgi:hypothetical protein